MCVRAGCTPFVLCRRGAVACLICIGSVGSLNPFTASPASIHLDGTRAATPDSARSMSLSAGGGGAAPAVVVLFCCPFCCMVAPGATWLQEKGCTWAIPAGEHAVRECVRAHNALHDSLAGRRPALSVRPCCGEASTCQSLWGGGACSGGVTCSASPSVEGVSVFWKVVSKTAVWVRWRWSVPGEGLDRPASTAPDPASRRLGDAGASLGIHRASGRGGGVHPSVY